MGGFCTLITYELTSLFTIYLLVGFLIQAGPGYRYIMYTAALLNMFWTRYLVMETYHALVRRIRQQRKLKPC